MTIPSFVFGNAFRLGYNMTLRTITEEGASDSEFYPSVAKVIVRQGAFSRAYDAEIDGDKVYFEDAGTLPIGKYDVEVLCRDSSNRPYRYKERQTLRIVDVTADAGIPSGVEFEVETRMLGAAVFLSGNSYDDSELRERVEALENAGFITSYTETDPTVPSWAKTPTKPSYTPGEVGAMPAGTPIPSKTSDLQNDSGFITRQDVSDKADKSSTYTKAEVDERIAGIVDSAPQTLDTLKELSDALGSDPNFATTMSAVLGNKVDKEQGKGLYPDVDKQKLAGIADGAEVNVQPDWNQTDTDADDFIKNKPSIPTVPTNVSSFNNDAGYLTQHQDISGKANSSDLADVATSGSYNDLRDKPVIPEGADLSNYYTKTEADTLLAEKAQRVIINMSLDANDQPVFTDANSDTLTHAQVRAILNNKQNEVFLSYDGREYRNYWYGGSEDSWTFEDRIWKGDKYISLTYEEGAIYIDEMVDEFIAPSDIGAQPTLVSGTNIKSINNMSLLGSGNMVIKALVFGKMENGNFYPAVEAALTPNTSWGFGGVTDPVSPNRNYLYIDVVANKIYRYENQQWIKMASLSLADFSGDSTHRLVTDAEKTAWDAKGSGTITGITMNGASKGTSGVVDLGTVITSHQDISGKADKSEMSVTAGTGNDADKTTIQLKSGTTATVLTTHQDISGKADVVPIVTVSTTGSVSQQLAPNTFYKFTGGVSSLTLTLNTTGTGLLTYFGKFLTASSGCQLSLPSTLTEAAGNATIEGGKTYEFHIVDNVIRISEV